MKRQAPDDGATAFSSRHRTRGAAAAAVDAVAAPLGICEFEQGGPRQASFVRSTDEAHGEFPEGVVWSEVFARRYLQQDCARLLIAHVADGYKNESAGYLLGHVGDDSDFTCPAGVAECGCISQPAGFLQLGSLVTLPRFRRRKVARRLVAQMVADTGAHSIGLECIERPLEAMYRSWVFDAQA